MDAGVGALVGVRQLVELGEAFLDAVFAEVDLAGGEGFADCFGRVGFGDGDQAHAGGVAVGALADLRDFGANRFEALGDRRGAAARLVARLGGHAVGAVSWSSGIRAGSGA